jgi:hypothetical protein
LELSEYHAWWKRDGGRQLRRLLLHEWDPIGVGDIPEAQDEYDGYLGPVARLLRERADENALYEYLSNVRQERMGLHASPAEDRRAARAIVEWWAQQPPMTAQE